MKVSAADTAASSQAIILAHMDSMVGKQFQVVLLLLLFPTSGRLKNPWNWSMSVGSGRSWSVRSQTSSPDLHRGTPCWSVVAPRYCRRLVWRTLSSPGGRGTSRGSWFGPQDINWSDRLPYLLLTITYRHWNFFFATNSLPPQWGTKQIAMALFLPNNTIVEFYSYQCHSLKKNFLRE